MNRIYRSESVRMAPQRDPSDISPPRTPPSQSTRYNPSKRPSHTRPPLRETFSDDATSFERSRRGGEEGDEPDPHDLSLSPQHAARTSIVDNMLLSLDQFASGSSVLEDYRLFNSALESGTYARNSQDSPAQSRYNRGHTFSSSLSSDNEGVAGRYGVQVSRGRRSDSSSNYHAGLTSVGVRSREGPRYHGAGRGSKSSTSSNVDFGTAFARDRTGSDSGSTSFDYGPAPRKGFAPFPDPSPGYGRLPFDEFDAAPTPNVPAGPRKLYSAINENSGLSHQPSRTPIASRRNSMKSARSTHAKKSHPENLGTSAIRGQDSDFQNYDDAGLDPPPPIPASLDPPAPSPTISYNKPSFPPPEQPPNKERPGFFRRVFGSSKASAPGPSDSVPSLQATDTKDSTGSSANLKGRKLPNKNDVPGPPREPPRQVVSKKSSFFRRRKKPVVDEGLPPPITIPQEFDPRVLDVKAEPSPVSSLRQVMNPYLADGSSAPYQDVREFPDSETAKENQNPTRMQRQNKGSALAPGSGPRSRDGRHQLPTSRGNDASTLTGGTERSSPLSDGSPMDTKREQHSSEGQQIPTKDGDKLQDSVDKQVDRPSPNDAIPQFTAPVSLSPVVEDASQKNASSEAPKDPTAKESGGLTPSQDRLDEPTKLPPIEATSASPTASASEASNYYTASNTPVIPQGEAKPDEESKAGPSDSERVGPTETDRQQAQKLFDSQDEVVGTEPAAAWLGDLDRAMVRKAYMELFDWSNMNIVAALRRLCSRLVLKGETQQVDRVLDAFSTRWCECNPRHGFKAAGT